MIRTQATFRGFRAAAVCGIFFVLGVFAALRSQTLQSLTPVQGTAVQLVASTTTWASTVSTLGQSDGLLSTVSIPGGAIAAAPGTAAAQEESASLLLAAANLAGSNHFSIRRGQLLQSAEQSLLSAVQLGSSTGAAGGRCNYLLGWLAERLHNDVSSAAAYYQKAVDADSTNSQAANALFRVNAILAFRQSLNH